MYKKDQTTQRRFTELRKFLHIHIVQISLPFNLVSIEPEGLQAGHIISLKKLEIIIFLTKTHLCTQNSVYLQHCMHSHAASHHHITHLSYIYLGKHTYYLGHDQSAHYHKFICLLHPSYTFDYYTQIIITFLHHMFGIALQIR